ncbi:MAG: 50S ribosomal protein L9 [Candidatus Peribacteria bacterium]|nr:MAG: 50S ribosomal protein L9 [Candidatus Peribacteria bacterium]
MGKKMEVLLVKPLVGRGNAGEVIDVKIHYANHYLFPNGIAVAYNKQTQNQRASQMKRVAAAKAELHEQVTAVIQQLETAGGFSFSKQATSTDSLYDSISEGDLVQYVAAQFNAQFDKKWFSLPEKIQALGEYTVSFSFENIQKDIPIHVTKA